MSNSAVTHIDLKATPARVWRALTDHREFGEWFRVAIDEPFEPGRPARGRMTVEGYEHLEWRVSVKDMITEKLFSFTWHPYAVDPEVDYSSEEPTLVEFVLEAIDGGTRLTVTESGFDKVPAHRREQAFRMNSEGWRIQSQNIKNHVESDASQ